jgi:peptidoglycan/xylan/chitin deacetylase (PgdA/CDA1 family)
MVAGTIDVGRGPGALSALALILTVCVPATARGTPGETRSSAVVLVYHRFGENDHPSTNTPLEQLEAQIAILRAGGYAVLPLREVVAALRAGGTLPDRAVAITIDDAYASAYAEAWPRLRGAGLPFTVFVSTDGVDAGQPDLMSWDQLRELERAGIGIGHHGAGHAHPLELAPREWRADLERASARFRSELAGAPSLLAYPYGEWSAALRDVVRELGFRAAFGQHSGVVSSGDDPLALPRFALNTRYGTPERFRRVVASLPLPIRDLEPSDPLVGGSPPPIRFRVGPGTRSPNCFLEGQPVRVERDDDHIRIPVPTSTEPRNLRINCTLRVETGRWRWLGLVFFQRP